MRALFSDETVLIQTRDAEDGPGDRLLLSFTGIGHGKSVGRVQKPEFPSAGNGFANTIFVTDITRSWGNALDFDAIGAVLAPHMRGREVYALGNSMGGFLAVLAAQFWPIRRVVGFVPQFSVRPKVIPKEARWSEYRAAISDWRYSSLQDRFSPETEYFLFSGRKGPDWRQWRRFPEAPNISNVLFSDLGHGVAKHLKRTGVLNPIIAACFEGRFSLAWLNETSPFKAELRAPKSGGPTPRPGRR